MAFGFKRLPGSSRRYQNIETGEVLSYRQFDKYVKSIGERKYLPPIENLREAARELRNVKNPDETTAKNLKTIESALNRREKTGAGQRRYNAVLASYVAEQHRQGKPISKRDAKTNTEFKKILDQIKGKPNKRGNPNIAAQNKQARLAAFAQLGGANEFREMYETLYGPRERAEYGRANNAGRSSFTPRRRVL